MSYIEDLNMSSMKKTPSPFNKFRRHRPLEDISNLESPLLPNIKEEEDSRGVSIETTPRRRVIRCSQSLIKELKTPDASCSQPTSSTPLSSRRQPTPKVQRPVLHNPFEADLLSRLHLPMCSPSVFSTIVSPTKSLDVKLRTCSQSRNLIYFDFRVKILTGQSRMCLGSNQLLLKSIQRRSSPALRTLRLNLEPNKPWTRNNKNLSYQKFCIYLCF
jgi:hypothetical protein